MTIPYLTINVPWNLFPPLHQLVPVRSSYPRLTPACHYPVNCSNPQVPRSTASTLTCSCHFSQPALQDLITSVPSFQLLKILSLLYHPSMPNVSLLLKGLNFIEIKRIAFACVAISIVLLIVLRFLEDHPLPFLPLSSFLGSSKAS